MSEQVPIDFFESLSETTSKIGPVVLQRQDRSGAWIIFQDRRTKLFRLGRARNGLDDVTVYRPYGISNENPDVAISLADLMMNLAAIIRDENP